MVSSIEVCFCRNHNNFSDFEKQICKFVAMNYNESTSRFRCLDAIFDPATHKICHYTMNILIIFDVWNQNLRTKTKTKKKIC